MSLPRRIGEKNQWVVVSGLMNVVRARVYYGGGAFLHRQLEATSFVRRLVTLNPARSDLSLIIRRPDLDPETT